MTGDSDQHPQRVGPDSELLVSRVATLEHAVDELRIQVGALLAAMSVPAAAREPSAPPTEGATSTSPSPARPAAIASSSLSPSPARSPSSVRTKKSSAIDLERLVAGRWLNRIGILAVAVGVLYFLKYAVDNDWIGPGGQVAIGLLLGAGILASVSWFHARGYAYFADGMTGLGAAVFYLSLWAGGSYYHLFPLALTFAGTVVVTAGMMAIAVTRGSQPVAVIALLGGFVSPMLVSTGQDAQATLFSYLVVLDVSLLPLAWMRDWRWIELPAFLFTEVYFWGWYSDFYVENRFAPTALAVAVLFAVFLVLPALRARRGRRVRFEQALIVPFNAGAALLAFAWMLLPEHRWALTAVALAMAAVHAFAARSVPIGDRQEGSRLVLGGTALTLLTLVVPIRLDGSWVTLAWAVEGAVVIWAGLRARVPAMRVLGFALFAIAGLMLTASSERRFPDERIILNARFLSEVVTVASFGVALWIARTYQQTMSELERFAFGVLGVAVNVCAIWMLTNEVGIYFLRVSSSSDTLAEGLAISLLWTLYASGLMIAGLRLAMAALRWQALVLFGATIVKVFVNDLASLSGFYRIGSSIVLGVVLLIVSFLYQRSLPAHQAAEGQAGDGL